MAEEAKERPQEGSEENAQAEAEKAAQQKITRRGRIISIVVWTLGVSYGLYEVLTHMDRMTGLHGAATALIVIVGVMCIFSEATALLKEPK